jgi:hypothetical protein
MRIKNCSTKKQPKNIILCMWGSKSNMLKSWSSSHKKQNPVKISCPELQLSLGNKHIYSYLTQAPVNSLAYVASFLKYLLTRILTIFLTSPKQIICQSGHTGHWWVVSFTPLPLFPKEFVLCTKRMRCLVSSRDFLDALEERIKFFLARNQTAFLRSFRP